MPKKYFVYITQYLLTFLYFPNRLFISNTSMRIMRIDFKSTSSPNNASKTLNGKGFGKSS